MTNPAPPKLPEWLEPYRRFLPVDAAHGMTPAALLAWQGSADPTDPRRIDRQRVFARSKQIESMLRETHDTGTCALCGCRTTQTERNQP